MAVGDFAVISGNELIWIPSRADMVYTTFTTSGTQFTAYSQPAAEADDEFVVEIVTPFTKSLPGTITLDIGTVGSPTAYIGNFDLTQVAGTFQGDSGISLGAALNSLTGATNIKARVNYTPGSLTAGEFLIHVRTALVK